jgi:hypothetical protein
MSFQYPALMIVISVYCQWPFQLIFVCIGGDVQACFELLPPPATFSRRESFEESR